jgi:glycosyltransferase involved in cell wall biosynthesis
MKKVCHITTVHSAFDTRIFYKEIETLVNAGYDVTLIAQHSSYQIVDGAKVIALPKAKNRFFRILFLTKKAYQLASEQKADIYHFHDPELLFWMIRLKKKTGAKIIYDVHENVSEQIIDKKWIPRILRKSVSALYSLKEKKFLSLIDGLVLAEDSYIKIYKNYKNTSIIRNYPLHLIKLLENKTKLQHDFPKLVYVGGISRARGMFEMIQAIKIIRQKFRNVEFKIAGPAEEKIKFEINNLIRYYKLSKNIIFCEKIPYLEALQLISKSNVGLSLLHPVPNYIESLSTKLFEYMAAGLPVIASNFPLWKEIVEGNKCGICVDPLDPKAIAKAAEYLIEHPIEAKRMGENGKRAVLKKYNWENEGKKLVKTYEELI